MSTAQTTTEFLYLTVKRKLLMKELVKKTSVLIGDLTSKLNDCYNRKNELETRLSSSTHRKNEELWLAKEVLVDLIKVTIPDLESQIEEMKKLMDETMNELLDD